MCIVRHGDWGAGAGTLEGTSAVLMAATDLQEDTVAEKNAKTGAYKVPRKLTKPESTNPRWLVPTFSTLFVVGVLWILAAYLFQGRYPLPIENWNLAVGFGFMVVGMALVSRWK